MAEEDGSVAFYEPTVRAVIPLDTFHVPRRLARHIRHSGYEMRVDHAFRRVMEECAAPVLGRESTWISQELIDAYVELHRIGLAHSVEVWRAGELVGGLYGVAIRGLFAGESMFNRVADASKVALVYLVERLQLGGFELLDSQYIVSDHLRQFGVEEIARGEYKRRLAAALNVDAHF